MWVMDEHSAVESISYKEISGIKEAPAYATELDRGYCLLFFDPYHATDLAQLPEREHDAFMLDLKQTGQALQRALHPDHMNYECLGNSGPHLHWHVIPRYQNDPRWGRPVWEGWPRNEFNIDRVVIGNQEYQDLVMSIRMCLHETEV